MPRQEVKLPLKTVLIGCGGMGRGQAKILAELEEYQLTAVCDVRAESAGQVAGELGVRAYTDPAMAIAWEKPEVVAICTDNASHARLTILAAESGAKAVYCEKPMATCLADARAMAGACRRRGVELVINHQRRIGPDLLEARRLIDGGAIGKLRCIRAMSPGDILSDGTHAVDSLMWLTGDAPIKRVFAAVHRDLEAMNQQRQKQKGPVDTRPVGWRYGHAVEGGATALMLNVNDIRLEIFGGDTTEGWRAYQDYEIIGTHGRLSRTGDQTTPNLFIQDAQGGAWSAQIGDWPYRPVPNPAAPAGSAGPPGATGQWRPVNLPGTPGGEVEKMSGIPGGYRRLVRLLQHGTPHPMHADLALRGFEVVMAIYESGRLRKPVAFPLQQDRFPLEVMLEEGYE